MTDADYLPKGIIAYDPDVYPPEAFSRLDPDYDLVAVPGFHRATVDAAIDARRWELDRQRLLPEFTD